MNLRCKVCGEKAAGFHFGAFTCEGCKSFFGRCCNNMSTIGECRNNNECIIDKKNRTSCKACRLQKCLRVGMSKSGSRYGRRSNWFKQCFQENGQCRQTVVSDVKHNEMDIIRNTELLHHGPSSPPLNDHKRLSKISGGGDTTRFTTPKIHPDLIFSTPMSSHFYANYFPHLANFSRLLTSSYSRESRFLLNDCEPVTVLNDFNFRNVSVCYENKTSFRYDKELPLGRKTTGENPLDLSRKSRNDIISEQEIRKTMPLDLSVK